MNEDFKVKINDFEGPLDLLLNLIEKRKLHISEISLAKVADDYINYIGRFVDYPIDKMANFIMVASTLMLIKSISLLPDFSLTPEEKESIEVLEERLQHYQRIKELSEHIKNLFGQKIIFNRETSREKMIIFAPTEDTTKENLWQAIKNCINALPKKEKLPATVIRKVISLEEVIGDLTKRIQSTMRLRFSDYVKDKKEKVNIIISFLGMLELVKQGIVEIEQRENFADIDIETKTIGIPRY